MPRQSVTSEPTEPKTRAETAALVFEQRMAFLGLSQQQLAEMSGVSTSTLRKLKRGVGEDYQPSKLSAVSRALGWMPDTLVRLLAGTFQGDPANLITATTMGRGLGRGLEGFPGSPAARSGVKVPEDFTDEELAEVQRFIDFLESRRHHGS